MSTPLISMEESDLTPPKEETNINSPQGKGETILFVEDNDLMREIGAQILGDLGYQVICAANGLEALKIFNDTNNIDLIFTDIVMPEIGGARLIQKIRDGGSLVKVIAVTGHVLAEELDQLRRAGVTSVIRKPYDVDILADAVSEALSEA